MLQTSLNFIGRNHLRILALLLGGYCLLLCGCTVAGTRVAAANPEAGRVAQNVADARAGIDAAKIQLGAAMDPRAGQMLDGAREYTTAAAGKTVIPAPMMSPGEIVQNPDGYHSAAVSTRQHADGTWLTVGIAAIATALLPVGVALLKDFGGPLGSLAANIALPMANTAWHTFAPRVAKDADARAVNVTAEAQTLLFAVDSLAPGQLGSLPQPLRAAIESLRAVHTG